MQASRSLWKRYLPQRRERAVGIAFAAMVLLLGSYGKPPSALQQIRARGELRVVTINAPTCYYLGAHGPQGFEYRLAAMFAQRLGVRLSVQTVSDASAMRAALAAGNADLAAAQITADARWQHIGEPTASYGEIAQLLVQVRSRPLAHDLASLHDAQLVVRADSPQLALLQSLGSAAPNFNWTVLPSAQTDPIDLVNNGNADYAIVDANEF